MDTPTNPPSVEANPSAVSWAAILSGTAAAAALTLVMMAIGSGLGLASASPWPREGMSVKTLAAAAGIWLIVTQWASSGLGGYLAGRLRTRWVATHTHEVFFRDTAHGFLTWAVASIVIAVIVATASTALVGKAADVGATVASTAATGAMANQAGTTLGAYDVDALFRPESNAGKGDRAESKGEATRILSKALTTGALPDADRSYLASQVASSTGVSVEEAQQRVDALVTRVKTADTQAREAADSARKAAATAALVDALAMLVGAFIASVAAALGGRERDLHP